MAEATYSQLIPFSELAPGQAAKIRASLVNDMVAEASQKLNKPPDQLVVRDIRAKDDLALYSGGSAASIEDWAGLSATTANTYETMATGTMADQRWIGIYGVKGDEGAQSVTAIRFTVGGAERVIWQLQSLNEDDGMVGFSPAGVIIPQNAPYTIARFVRTINSQTRLVLKGVVVEPRGKVVSP